MRNGSPISFRDGRAVLWPLKTSRFASTRRRTVQTGWAAACGRRAVRAVQSHRHQAGHRSLRTAAQRPARERPLPWLLWLWLAYGVAGGSSASAWGPCCSPSSLAVAHPTTPGGWEAAPPSGRCSATGHARVVDPLHADHDRERMEHLAQIPPLRRGAAASPVVRTGRTGVVVPKCARRVGSIRICLPEQQGVPRPEGPP